MVLSLLLPALLVGLGDRPLYKIQEVRIAETAREMVASGDWIIPRYNGELRLQKPPLPYWATAASYNGFGVNALAARLPSAIFAVAGVCLLFFWCRRHLNVAAATGAALALATSFIGLRYFRSGEADAMLLFFIAATCLAGYQILNGSNGRHAVWIFFAMLGLGFATKGPAALAIPLITLLAVAGTERRTAALRPLLNPGGWALFLLLAFSWYGLLLWNMPDAAQYFIGKQVDETFVSGTHAKPFWWYFVHVFDFFAPWSLLLIPAAIRLYRTRPVPPPVRFALIWLGVVFVLLMCTVNKQMQYALLMAPPLSIILGHYIGELKPSARWRKWISAALWCALGAFSIIAYIKHPETGVSAALWPALALLPLLCSRLLRADTTATALLLTAGLFVSIFLYMEKYGSADLDKIQVQTLMKEAAAQQPLYQLKPGDGAISFYARRVVPPVDPGKLPELVAAQGEIWLIAEKDQTIIAGAERVLARGDLVLWRMHSGRLAPHRPTAAVSRLSAGSSLGQGIQKNTGGDSGPQKNGQPEK